MDASKQTSDAVNSKGFGTNQLSERQGDVLISNPQQGGTAKKGNAEKPAQKVGAK